ncbi:MAG: hypothetical protein A2V88_09185 [Elusimicrobia bacterium RBG_16_66_12]|nr:MAG: hypothetical protein A2V88_09185 [Elusimicrobia bacterium RBG_16_66_12]
MKTKTTTRPEIGSKTPRGGAVIIARSLIDAGGWAVVLAVKLDGEYVTWNESAEAEYQSGEYYREFGDAAASFTLRAKGGR